MTAGGNDPRGHAERLQALQTRLGYEFRRIELLDEALTHPSFQGEAGRRKCNERMEFLGDRVLGLVIANLLFQKFRREEVGALARRHAALVRREALVQVADELGLAACIRISRGEEDAGGRTNPGLLGDACEALIAALYIDGGLETAKAFFAKFWAEAGFDAAQDVVERLWCPLVERDASPPKDAKTMLQEWAQGRGLPLPSYIETDRSGPPHAPIFLVQVIVEGFPAVTASGSSKRLAERAAAEMMLMKVRLAHGS
jgi:ribonuclease-3